MIDISEIFYSVQGETSLAGRPAVFVRTAGCNLNCRWCDTVYSKEKKYDKAVDEIIDEVSAFGCPVVVLTGGEPLIQEESRELMEKLAGKGFYVVLETNGSVDIDKVPGEVKIILDVKTPSSGETGSIYSPNMKKLGKKDELKFVISDREDFDWSCGVLREYPSPAGEILFSPVKGKISFNQLADWVMDDAPGGRVQANLHKVFSMR
ncbi:MAG: radical SAM protein [Elusimicrobiota bacterium]